MSSKKTLKSSRDLSPFPRPLVNLYGIIAILLVIIPEAFAKIFIEVNGKYKRHQLNKKDHEWEVNTELKLATMNIKELRFLAKSLQLFGYSSETPDSLRKRLLKKLPPKLEPKE